jgi:hypothetical protein
MDELIALLFMLATQDNIAFVFVDNISEIVGFNIEERSGFRVMGLLNALAGRIGERVGVIGTVGCTLMIDPATRKSDAVRLKRLMEKC